MKFVICGMLALAGWLTIAEAVEAGCRRGGGRLFSGRLFQRGAAVDAVLWVVSRSYYRNQRSTRSRTGRWFFCIRS